MLKTKINPRGFRQLNPLPNAAEIADYYTDDKFYTNHSPSDWLEKEAREYMNGLWNNYFHYLEKIAIANPFDNVLDWGCGGGWWLAYLAKKRTDLYLSGVEPSHRARAFANVWGADTTDIKATGDDFPLDTLWETISLQLVLEHLPEPERFLKYEIYPRLCSGGRLLITVPNDYNPLQNRLGWTGFISDVHINYFNPVGLRNLLTACGFRVIHESATFPMEIFILLGFDYRGNDSLGRNCHNFRLKLEKLMGVRIFNWYQKLYQKWGIGRELVFVAEKV